MKNTVSRCFRFILIFLFVVPTYAQQDLEPKVGFKDYVLHQYIRARVPPQSILDMDNNGDIILACISKKTMDQLSSQGIPCTESQLFLLKTFDLLREKDDAFEVAFPILDRSRTMLLRDYSLKAVPKLAEALKADIVQLADVLKSSKREKNIYTILFAYVLDHLVWVQFENNHLSTKQELSLENPFWGGEVWASYPPREFSCGTNTIAEKGIQLKVNWSESVIPKMIPFVADWKNFGRMFDDYVDKGRVVDAQAKKVFAPFNLFDDSGNFTIPVIEEKSENPLYGLCLTIAAKTAEQVPGIIDLDEITERFGFRDKKQAMVIIYHELMWDLLDELAKQGIIRQPVAFSDPKNTESKDIADLVFIVRGD
jgi:hypothetical protein